MNYGEFKTRIMEMLQAEIEKQSLDTKASFREIDKNNNIKKDAIIINQNKGIPEPAFYMDKYFDDYKQGRGLDSIVAEMIEVSQSQSKSMGRIMTMVDVMDYESIKEYLVPQLISRSTNEEMMDNVPHHDVENTDLTAIMRISIQLGEDGVGSSLIQNEMLSVWNVSEEQIYQDALSNAVKSEPLSLRSMWDVMMGIAEGSPELENFLAETEPNQHEMYVLTNSSGVLGASALLYPETLQRIAENFDSNLFVLPSSIHEVILLSDTGEVSAEELQAMVMTINQAEVPAEDVLSNEVYIYDRETQSLSMATSREHTEELKKRILGDTSIDEELDFNLDMER